MPTTSGSPTQIRTAFASASELEGAATGAMDAGDTATIQPPEGGVILTYQLDPLSNLPADGYRVILPPEANPRYGSSGPRRWLLTNVAAVANDACNAQKTVHFSTQAGVFRYQIPVPAFFQSGPQSTVVSLDGTPLINGVDYVQSGRDPAGGVPPTVADVMFAIVLSKAPAAGQLLTVGYVNPCLDYPDTNIAPIYLIPAGPSGAYVPDQTTRWYGRTSGPPWHVPAPINQPPPFPFFNGVQLPPLPTGLVYEFWRRLNRGGGQDNHRPHRFGRRYYPYFRGLPANPSQDPNIFHRLDITRASRQFDFRVRVFRPADGARSNLSLLRFTINPLQGKVIVHA